MPGYTDSPIGALLAQLGRGIPALAQDRRSRDIQDQAIALQQQEAQSKLKTEGLQQQVLQGTVNQQPSDIAWKEYQRTNEAAPLESPLIAHDQLRAAGVRLPEGYVPLDKQMNIQRQQMMMQAFPELVRGAMGQAGPQASAGAPQASGGIHLTPTEMMRWAQTGQFPTATAQEAADTASAKKIAETQAGQQMGQLPEADDKFVQSAMSYYTQLQDAKAGLMDPHVQKGGMPQMLFERGKYLTGFGNSAPYDKIIPALDMSHQLVLTDLANGVRNATTRAQLGQHLASSSDSPQAALQKIDNILRYYPYLVHARYASRGVQMPDAVAQGMGYKTAADLGAYVQTLDNSKPDSVGQNSSAAQPGLAAQQQSGIDPRLAKYAKLRGISIEQAQALASQLK